MNINKITIIILIAIFLLFFSTFSFAKFSKIFFIKSASTEIASPIFNVNLNLENQKLIDLSNNEIEYNFSISNFENSNISRVSQNYYIELYSTDVDLSLFQISILKDNTPVLLVDNKTSKFVLSSNNPETHNYTIKISYQNNVETSIIGQIHAKIISNQICPKTVEV